MSIQPWEARIASLDGCYHQVSDRLNSIDRRLDGFEQKVDSRFQATDSKIDGLQWRMTAFILGTWITVMASIFFHH
ncbi:MAG: hypothetical protein JO104_04230 [Candidatus Eremiobacteraeota bacterium]|nr:hypothetical protein [Candidatus Eremiobacteraeota bacterium]